MNEFKSLQPAGLPDAFDVEAHGDEPILKMDPPSENRITLKYVFPGFYLSEDSQEVDGKRLSFQEVDISKTGFLSEKGGPLLPSLGRYVQIPFNCDYAVKVKKSKPLTFDDVLVKPSQEMTVDGGDEEPEFEYDRELYEKNELYPREVVEVSGPFEMDGYIAILVHIRPLQYNPAKKQLMGYGSITVTIYLTKKDTDADEYVMTDPELHRDAYGNLFVNPGRDITGILGLPDPGKIIFPWLFGPEFLIIHHNTLQAAARELADWKTLRGIPSETVSIDTVGNTVDNIKNHIRGERRKPWSRLRYVLLLGDVDMITAETIAVSPYGANVSDYYYSTPSDPLTPADCILPWLSIGRIPVRTADEAMDVVNQVIAYEKMPPCDPEYYKRMAFAAYFQDNYPQDGRADRAYIKTMEYIRRHMVTLGFDVERVYVSNNPSPQEYIDGTPLPAEVKEAIVENTTAADMIISTTAEGQLFTGHRDHGGPEGWSHPPFNINHIEAIASDYPTIFYSVNCLTGMYDLKAPGESFAEKLLRVKGGAPSLVAATRVSGTWRNDSLMKALFDAMWGGVLPTFPDSTASYPVKYNRLGDILNYAKTYLPVAHGNNAGVKDHFEIYHIIGDPTLEIWKAQPLGIDIRTSVRRMMLNVILSSCPKGCVVTLKHKDRILKQVRPHSRFITFPLKQFFLNQLPVCRGQLCLCFWANGYRFRKINVRV